MMMCCLLEYFIPLYMYIYVFLACLCLQTCLAVVDQSVALIKKVLREIQNVSSYQMRLLFRSSDQLVHG